MLTFVLALTLLCSTAFAVSKTKTVNGYGTLRGELEPGSSYSLSTSITTNPDNAYLRCKSEVQNSAGTTLGTKTRTGSRGAVGLYFSWNISGYLNPSRIFSTHEVKGGSTYDSAAVYLNMAVN